MQVWYAAHYADRMGMKPHELMEADWATLDEQASRFQCCECNRKFRTSMALQRHLLEHETEEPVAVEVNDIKDDKETKSGSGEGADSNNKAASARSGLLRNKARQVTENNWKDIFWVGVRDVNSYESFGLTKPCVST